MKKILTEPLFHFLLIGTLLFAIFEILPDSDKGSRNTIIISETDKEALRANFVRTWQRNPTPKELEGLVEDKIRDEIAYREALALGLDKNDAYIRRRLRMKMELILEDINALNPPSEKELEAFLKKNSEKFREEEQISFSHIYLDPAKHRNTLEEDVEQLLHQLAESGVAINVDAYGDPTMLPKSYPLTPADVIDRQFGVGFSDHLDATDIGQWQGPVQSGYGYHLVLLHDYKAGRDPKLSEIRTVVEREYMAERRTEIKDTTYAKLREKYEIIRETEDTPNS